MIRNKKENPILVSGSHRCGTTWVGKVINSSNTVNYLHEPLKPGTIYRDIKFSKNVKEYIINSSSQNNPTERADSNVHVLNRNSKGISEIFKKRLTEEQIFYIKNKTRNIRLKFYEN